jgi:hypothetical protein
MLCRMNGSTPERKISYFPLRSNLMALAVSPDESAAVGLQTAAAHRRTFSIPEAPLWISIPPAALNKNDSLPAGTRMFADTLKNADQISLAVAPQDGRFAARLNVTCRDPQQADLLAGQLQRITSLLREMIEREKQTPNPRDFSGVLTSGSFTHTGSQVTGTWPLQKEFLENLAAGG